MTEEEKKIEELSDLSYFKDSYLGPLNEMGILSINDLRDALMDEERTTLIREKISGVGPRTIGLWKKALLDDSVSDMPSQSEEGNEAEMPEEDQEVAQSVDVEVAVEEGPTSTHEEGQEVQEVSTEVAQESAPEPEEETHNLFCSMEELDEVKEDLMDLLKWNGSKKKGLSSMLKYCREKLEKAGLNVSLIEEDCPPVIIASQGEGGVVLWGHLDTEAQGEMIDQLHGVESEGVIYGRGTTDMKGAVAVLLSVAGKMASWKVPFTIVLTTDGLSEKEGAEKVAQMPMVKGSKGVLILAPTNMMPLSGKSGFIDLSVEISGDDSVLAMAKFLVKLSQTEEILGKRNG